MPLEPTQPPIWSPPLSGRDAALVAGYILHFREGIVLGGQFFDLGDPTINPAWTGPERRWFEIAEQVTRYLLWWTGYRVAKGELWPGEFSRDRP